MFLLNLHISYGSSTSKKKWEAQNKYYVPKRDSEAIKYFFNLRAAQVRPFWERERGNNIGIKLSSYVKNYVSENVLTGPGKLRF